MSEETKSTRQVKEMTPGKALFGSLVPILVLVGLIILGADVAIATLAAVFVIVIFVCWMGYPWKRVEKGMTNGLASISQALLVMLLVGCMIGVLMSAGCIPTLLYYGIQIVSPKLFLPICFILPAFMGVCCGTSWGAVSTIGVVLCGMSAGMGIPVYIAAGAVISGAYFGDKMSPLSDTTLLASASCGVSVFDHIVSMLYTTIPATIVSLVLYSFIGIRASGSIDTAAVSELTTGLAGIFHISILNIIPLLIVLVLSVKRVPAIITFGVGIAAGLIWSMVFQGFTFADNLGFLMNGFSVESGVDAVDVLVNRGGFSSMLSLIGIMIGCGMMNGLYDEFKILEGIVSGILERVHSPKGVMVVVMIVAFLLALAGGQYSAICITAVAFRPACDKFDINRGVLSRTLEDVGTMISAAIPWNAWTMAMAAVLGTTAIEMIPFNFLCYLCSVVALINILLGVGLLRAKDPIKYRPFWVRSKAK